MIQVVLSPLIVIMINLEVSFMPLENTYNTGIALDNHNIIIVHSIGHYLACPTDLKLGLVEGEITEPKSSLPE
jgi:hypothetical protein